MFSNINSCYISLPTMWRTCNCIVILLFVREVINSSSVKVKNSDERILLVSPVLAPHRNSKAPIETAKDFPVLTLLAGEIINGNKFEINEDSKDEYFKHEPITQANMKVALTSEAASRNSKIKTDTMLAKLKVAANDDYVDNKAKNQIYDISMHEPIYIQKLQDQK